MQNQEKLEDNQNEYQEMEPLEDKRILSNNSIFRISDLIVQNPKWFKGIMLFALFAEIISMFLDYKKGHRGVQNMMPHVLFLIIIIYIMIKYQDSVKKI
jgi:hypothetical protein